MISARWISVDRFDIICDDELKWISFLMKFRLDVKLIMLLISKITVDDIITACGSWEHFRQTFFDWSESCAVMSQKMCFHWAVSSVKILSDLSSSAEVRMSERKLWCKIKSFRNKWFVVSVWCVSLTWWLISKSHSWNWISCSVSFCVMFIFVISDLCVWITISNTEVSRRESVLKSTWVSISV